MKRWLGILGILILASFTMTQANAQGAPPPPNGQTQDRSGPAPGVARISLIHGDVSTQRGDSGDWVGAVLNTPVLAGDKLSTADGARVEVQLDFANILRLAGRTQANIASLGENRIQIQVANGLVEFAVLKGTDSDVEIDTPNVSVHTLREGIYRIQVNDDGETLVIVRAGEVEISTRDGSTKIGRGQMITVHGTATDAQFKTSNAPGRDDFDKWNEDRDHVITSAQSWDHVSPYYTGTQDLDANGTWNNVPDYGSAWAPNVGSDWTPYSAGDFVWEPYYGWTWVSNEPWGWAPYHYGRWFRYSNRWMWWPGPVYGGYRPQWAPAYVSFFGFGNDYGIGSGYGFGSIGWLPIGPCDPFFPWYGVGFGFRSNSFGFRDWDDFRFRERRDFDDFHERFPGAHDPLARRFDERFSNFHQASRDQNVLRSVNSVRSEQFGRGGSGRKSGISPNEFQNGHMISGGVPVVPTRENLRPGGREANPRTIPSGGGQSSTLFTGSRPQPAAGQNSFNNKAGQIRESLRNNGQNGGQGGTFTPNRNGGGVQQGNSNGNNDRPSRNGFTERPGVDSANPNTRGQDSGNRPGWQRFGNGGDNSAGTTNGNGSGQPTDRGPARTFEGQRNDRPPQNSQVMPARPQTGQPDRNSGGWQSFSNQPNGPPQQGTRSRGNDSTVIDRPNGNGQTGNDRPNGQGYQQPVQPRYQGEPTYRNAPSSNAPNNNSRPPLELRKPVVDERPQQQSQPAYRYSPPPAPNRSEPSPSRPSYNPPPQQSRPSYGPPPQQQSRPSYSPPPQQQSRPSYSPPPQQSRPSYSPPPQQSRPSYSPPPSRPSGGSGGGGSHGNSNGSSSDSRGSSGGGSHHH